MSHINLIFMVLACVLLPFYRGDGMYGWDYARSRLMVLFTGFVIAGGLVAGMPPPGGNALILLSLMVAVLLASTFISDKRSADGIDRVLSWGSLAYLYWIASTFPIDILALIVFVPAPAVALWGIYQQIFKRDPLNKGVDLFLKMRAKKTSCMSFIGNTNHLSAYLVPCFFAGLYLTVTESFWYLMPLVPIWLAIGLTYCRAGCISTICGLGAVVLRMNPGLWPIFVALCFAAFLISCKRIEPTVGRIFYALEGFMLFKKRPVLGWGAAGFRREHFDVQAQLNNRDPSILGDSKTPPKIGFPMAEHSHNEYVEMAVSSGIVGLGLLISFLGVSFYGGLSVNPFIFGGIVAGIVHAMFFYNFTVMAGAAQFIVLCAMASPSIGSHVSVPWFAAIPLAILFIFIGLRCGLGPFLAGKRYHEASMEIDHEKRTAILKRAMALDYIQRGSYLYQITISTLAKDVTEATIWAEKMINHWDGEKVAWNAWDLYARIMQLNGALLMARIAFKRALFYKPGFQPSVQGLVEVNQIIKQCENIGKQRGQEIKLARKTHKRS